MGDAMHAMCMLWLSLTLVNFVKIARRIFTFFPAPDISISLLFLTLLGKDQDAGRSSEWLIWREKCFIFLL